MKLKLIALVAIMSLTVALGAPAAVQSIRVSGDINAEAVARDIEAWDGSETFVLSQVRLRLDADLTEGVGATVRLINERLWGVDDDSDSRIDLDLAYIQLDDVMDMPMMVRIGRQDIRYGNALIIGDSGIALAKDDVPGTIAQADLSLRQSFDAARVVLDYAPFTIDLLYASINEGYSSVRRDDVNLWGTNVAYDWANHNGITEGYFFHLNEGKMTDAENRDYTNTVGVRTQFDLDDHLTLGAEGAFQFGKIASDPTDTVSRRAYAAQFNTEYRFLDVNNSKVGASFTYLSGDSMDNTRNNEWNPMFEDQVPAEIINILFPNSNLLYTTLSGSMMPQEDVTLGLQWTFAKLANSYRNPTTLSGGLVDASLQPDVKQIGNEINAYLLYDYTEDVQVKLTGAWFMPGSNLFGQEYGSLDYSLRAGINVDF